jgi:hypothetical protein
MSLRRTLVVLALVLVAVSAVSGSALAAAGARAATKPCLLVAKGPAWSAKGQTGTNYNVIGVSGASCATGVKWLGRLTHQSSMVFKGPSGWSCIAMASGKVHQGECTLKGGGIIEWGPALKH